MKKNCKTELPSSDRPDCTQLFISNRGVILINTDRKQTTDNLSFLKYLLKCNTQSYILKAQQGDYMN